MTHYKKLYEDLLMKNDEETAEFNAGYEAAECGESIDSEPAYCPHDIWRSGYQAGAYARLTAELSVLRAAQIKPDCAFDDIKSPDFDGCNGCVYNCALGVYPPRKVIEK